MNYANTKIYKIWSTQGDKIYIGATTKKYLSQRMTSHRHKYNYWKNEEGTYTSSFILFEEYDITNCFIELLEAKECKDKHEQAKLEGKYIRELECVNKIIPDRTSEEYSREYYNNNKEKRKEYYINNRERIREHQKVYRQENK